jgi:hypothetical protein
VLALWGVKDLRVSVPIGVIVTIALAVVSVAGTRDFLVFEQTAWRMADQANRSGIDNTHLVSTAARDAYLLFDRALVDGIPDFKLGGDPWWVDQLSLPTDQRYAVVTEPPRGYRPVRRVEYSSWLSAEPVSLILAVRERGSGG